VTGVAGSPVQSTPFETAWQTLYALALPVVFYCWTLEPCNLWGMKEAKHLKGRGRVQPSFFFSHALINRNHVISQHNKYGIKQTLTA